MKLILDFQTDFHKEFYMDKINRTVAKTGFFCESLRCPVGLNVVKMILS